MNAVAPGNVADSRVLGGRRRRAGSSLPPPVQRFRRPRSRRTGTGGFSLHLRGGLLVTTVVWAGLGSATEIRFNRDVLPILAANCLACHGFDAHARQAGLRLDTAPGATATLESGSAAIVPGDAASSELLIRIESDDADIVMPPPDSGRSLSAEQRRILRDWVAAGGSYEPHWAFTPPAQVPVPPAASGPAAANIPDSDHPVDRFIAERLAAAGLAPAPEAAPETLLRRVHLDLTGLPPTIAEIDAYLARRAEDPEAAYREAVDRLLASPHYGERLARWWLDQARYADSNGYSIDAPREIWKWRDWVIDAFNRDLPFDRFTIEQLAGDLLPGAGMAQRVATGFHRNTQINQEGGIDQEQFRIDSVFDRVATTGVVWLGLSIGCAQCHDHKFDPVSQHDYYRLFAFLNNQDEPAIKVPGPGVDLATLEADHAAAVLAADARVTDRGSELAAWEAGLDAPARERLPQPVRAALAVAADKRSAAHRRTLYAAGIGADDADFAALEARRGSLEATLAAIPTTLVLRERSEPRRTTLLVQGDFTRPGAEVAPGTPAMLPPLAPTDAAPTRLDLARWLVDPGNPLTARVLVNRVWQRLFGAGLVETDNDFGLMGTPPSHPELLDWLARAVVERGWSLKELHRLLVTSRTYRQSSHAAAEHADADPHDRLLARQRRLRLDAEIVRDVALAASGRLVPTIGGPPVFPPIPEGATALGQVKRAWQTSTGPDRYRRGLYTFVFRATPPPAMAVFDAPEGFTTCTRRNRSNTPLQALTLLNDTAFVELAGALGAIVEAEGIETAFRRCTARRPDAAEAAVLAALSPGEAARVLLNLDETMTRE